MDIVSFETAKALKEAGFPQPDPKDGQIWYSQFQGCVPGVLVNLARSVYIFNYCALQEWDNLQRAARNPIESGEQEWIFAPTATDILRQIPEYSLSLEMGQTKSGEEWLVFDSGAPRGERTLFKHETNPGEACAAAWLAEQSG